MSSQRRRMRGHASTTTETETTTTEAMGLRVRRQRATCDAEDAGDTSSGEDDPVPQFSIQQRSGLAIAAKLQSSSSSSLASIISQPFKRDHETRPVIIDPTGRILLEAFSPLSDAASDFLTAIAEPLSRPVYVHEFRLSAYSLLAAVSVGLDTENIIEVLSTICKNELPPEVIELIRRETQTYGKVKLVLKDNQRYYLESHDLAILKRLLRNETISMARVRLGNDDNAPGVRNVVGGGQLARMLIDGDPMLKDIGDDEFITDFAPQPIVVSTNNKRKRDSGSGRGRGRGAAAKRGGERDEVAVPASFRGKEKDKPATPVVVKESSSGSKQNDDDELSEIDLFGDLFGNASGLTRLSSSNPKPATTDEPTQDDPMSVDDDDQRRPPPPPKEQSAAEFRPVEDFDEYEEDPDWIAAATAALQQLPDQPQIQQPQQQQPPQQQQMIVRSFEVRAEHVEAVRKTCDKLGFPVLQEYDFRTDQTVSNLNINLKVSTTLRPYQEKALNKMFSSGRARSGIIVLPCGAGKTLVGVAAACTIKKPCLVLCTSTVSVEQWAREFRTWSTLSDSDVARFTSDRREKFSGPAGVLISTYTMITYSGKRAYDAKQIMDFVCSREWGLLLLDEVHVVPAEMFRKVLTIVHAHAKLGLTATLVREDDKITSLNYLIGPKLFEANWRDLAADGFIANVKCCEVWCELTKEFMGEYLGSTDVRKRALMCAANPAKIRACKYLVDFHESRGDKVIVFSDNIFALKHYAKIVDRPFIYGGTSQVERMRILQQFRHNPALNTIFLSKVGDTSIDIPEASCLIQISSHYGSRRQEAQRLGRILRAKKPNGLTAHNPSEYNAFFYTLVSRDTEDVYYSAKRQQFLSDQGYSFTILTRLEVGGGGQQQHHFGGFRNDQQVYGTLKERLELLSTILVSGMDEEEEPDEDEMEFDDDDEGMSAADAALARGGGAGGRSGGATAALVKERRAGTLKSLSGGDSMAYDEVGVRQGKRARNSQMKGR